MATTVKSQSELYEMGANEVKSIKPELTDFEEGSINDLWLGVSSFMVSEATKLIIDQFMKTFLDTAEGTDLEKLAVDHYGSTFARLAATKATGIVQFSRPNNSAGTCIIPAGTIVKTEVNANGETQRFKTVIEVSLTGTSVNATVEAMTAGTKGNIAAGDVTDIESTLTDATVTVTNADEFVGGQPIQDDATYRAYVRNKILQLEGATKRALEAATLTVPGVVTATVLETEETVIGYNIDSSTTEGDFFYIPRVKVYVADANGSANSALIQQVKTKLDAVRACGVKLDILGANGITLNWNASITLDSGGPNFALFQSDTTLIVDSMKSYIKGLNIGQDFIRANAEAYIMSVWGPSGTGDLSDFSTNIPVADIDVDTTEKLVPGTVTIS